MAKNIILKSANTFIVEMSEEDMEDLAYVVEQKNSNYFDVVIACFHAGLVTLSAHALRHQTERNQTNVQEN